MLFLVLSGACAGWAWPLYGGIIQHLQTVTKTGRANILGNHGIICFIQDLPFLLGTKKEARLGKQLRTLENLSHWQSQPR